MGIQAKAQKERAQLRKGEIKRNLRIKRREEESKLGVLIVPLSPHCRASVTLSHTHTHPQPQENLVAII